MEYRIRELTDIPQNDDTERSVLQTLMNQMAQGGWQFDSTVPYENAQGGTTLSYLFKKD